MVARHGWNLKILTICIFFLALFIGNKRNRQKVYIRLHVELCLMDKIDNFLNNWPLFFKFSESLKSMHIFNLLLHYFPQIKPLVPIYLIDPHRVEKFEH